MCLDIVLYLWFDWLDTLLPQTRDLAPYLCSSCTSKEEYHEQGEEYRPRVYGMDSSRHDGCQNA